MKRFLPYLVAVLVCVALSGGFLKASGDNGPFERIAFRVLPDADRGAEKLPDKFGKNLRIPLEGRQYKILNRETGVLTTYLVEEVREGGVLRFRNDDDDFGGDGELVQVPAKYIAGVFLRFLHEKRRN